MPGRFALAADATQLQAAFPWMEVPDQVVPRYNVAPTQPVAVVTNEGANQLDFLTWGLVPPWQSGVKMDKLLINARSETAASKRSFRNAFRRRRCLVLATGVFEWVKFPRRKAKVPYYIFLKGQPVFAYAGLWETWQSIDGSEVKSCCILTCEPNKMVRKIHHRMGVILHPEDYETWLQPGEANPKHMQALLLPYPAKEMDFYQVSQKVSDVRNEGPELVQAVENPLEFPPPKQEAMF